MKKLLLIALFSTTFIACQKKDSEPDLTEMPIVTGQLYGTPFTAQAMIERYTEFGFSGYQAEELFAIYLSVNKEQNCTSDADQFVVRLSVPKKVGKYAANDTYISIIDPKDPKNRILFSSEQSTIEITAITPDMVRGIVDAKDDFGDTGSAIKGRFEARICK